jgi:thioredoxin-like negative regulator of GroEL
MGPGGGMAGMGGGAAGPGMERRLQQFEAMRGYLDIVDKFGRMARDPAMSGIAAVVSAGDILKPRGTDAAIEYFTKLLPDAKNPSVIRAIRLQLVDLYKASGKQDQALEQLRTIITADTSNEPAAPPLPPPNSGGPGGGNGPGR